MKMTITLFYRTNFKQFSLCKDKQPVTIVAEVEQTYQLTTRKRELPHVLCGTDINILQFLK